jgi:hypothetical protein
MNPYAQGSLSTVSTYINEIDGFHKTVSKTERISQRFAPHPRS